MPLTTLLFDLDGTLVDSDPLHLKSFQIMAERHDGVRVDQDFFARRLSGQSNAAICKLLWPDRPDGDHRRLADEKEALFRSMLTGIEPVPGLIDLLDWAGRRDLRLGVVSNAPLANLTAVVDALGITSRFSVLVSAEDLPRGKPDPLPYKTALERLGGWAESTVAFEDAVPGITAAVAAAIPTVALATTRPHAVLRESGASLVADDFTDERLWTYLDGLCAASE